MKDLIYDYFKYTIKYIISISVITILCFNMVLFGYQFKHILEPVYGLTANSSAVTNSHVLNAQDQNQVLTPSSTTVSKQILPSIKITSVSKGQQVPVGELEISGISSDSQANQCDISVMLNGIKPYQHVIPEGHGGSSDFSRWKYSFTPQYGIISNGMNKITSKISCPTESGTDLTKFNSVNVIGTSNSSHSTSHQTLNLESTTTTVGNRTSTSTTQSPVTNTLGSNVIQSSTNSIESRNPNLKAISISFNVDRNPVIRGHTQTITIALYDSNTNARIVGAKIAGHIIDSSNLIKKEFAGTTNAKGELSYSWKITETGKSNDEYKVKVDVIASGYPNEQYSTIFKVRGGHNLDTPFILAQANSKFNDELVDSINDFTQSMLDNVKQKLNITGNR
jgi:hypothetical protein